MEAREEKEDASPCRNFLKNVKMILQVTIAVFYLTLLESEKPSLVGLAWLGSARLGSAKLGQARLG